jgi:hypothetical protein
MSIKLDERYISNCTWRRVVRRDEDLESNISDFRVYRCGALFLLDSIMKQ